MACYVIVRQTLDWERAAPEAIVGPAGSEFLIGELVLEALDLIADCRRRTLAPRHREGPVLAIR